MGAYFWRKNFCFPPPSFLHPSRLLIFEFFSKENDIFVTRFEILRQQPPEVFLFISQLGLIFHFNFQFTRSDSNLKDLFSHCFSTFSLSINYKLCSYIGKFWYIYVIAITINKKPPCFFQSLLQLYFTEFSNPPVYYDLPPVYSWPMSFSQARLPIRKKHHCSLDFCTDAPVNAIFHLEIIFK